MARCRGIGTGGGKREGNLAGKVLAKDGKIGAAIFTCLRKGGQVCYAVAGDNHYHAILGGELSYIVHPSDLAPALIALGARIKIAGPAGEKTMPLEKFFVLPQVNFNPVTHSCTLVPW